MKDQENLKVPYVPTTNAINQVLLISILTDLTNGNYRRCVSFGLEDETLQLLQKLTPKQQVKIMSSPAIWARFTIDNTALKRLIVQTEGDILEDDLINKIIKLGGSNSLLNRYFGIYSGEISTRRKLLNYPVNKGRNAGLSMKEKDNVWKIWRLFKKKEPEEGYTAIQELQTIIHIAERLKINITSVWQELSAYKELAINDDSID